MLGGILTAVGQVAGVAGSVIGGGKDSPPDWNEGLKYGYSPQAWADMGIGYRAIARGERTGTVPAYYKEGKYALTGNTTGTIAGNAGSGQTSQAGIIGGVSNATLLLIAAAVLFLSFRN